MYYNIDIKEENEYGINRIATKVTETKLIEFINKHITDTKWIIITKYIQ